MKLTRDVTVCKTHIHVEHRESRNFGTSVGYDQLVSQTDALDCASKNLIRAFVINMQHVRAIHVPDACESDYKLNYR